MSDDINCTPRPEKPNTSQSPITWYEFKGASLSKCALRLGGGGGSRVCSSCAERVQAGDLLQQLQADMITCTVILCGKERKMAAVFIIALLILQMLYKQYDRRVE